LSNTAGEFEGGGEVSLRGSAKRRRGILIPPWKCPVSPKDIQQEFMRRDTRRAGVISTGNASRGGFSSTPGIGPHAFYMEAGSHKPGDIIKATTSGLWLKDVTGYGINPVNGNLSGGASGLWIEGGQVAFPVKGVTIAGTAGDMLNGIDMIGNDLDLNRRLTAPTFRIAVMQIGGE